MVLGTGSGAVESAAGGDRSAGLAGPKTPEVGSRQRNPLRKPASDVCKVPRREPNLGGVFLCAVVCRGMFWRLRSGHMRLSDFSMTFSCGFYIRNLAEPFYGVSEDGTFEALADSTFSKTDLQKGSI